MTSEVWVSAYTDSFCSTASEAAVPVITAPAGIDSDWSYTVGESGEDMDFETYTCTGTCGTLSYQPHMSGYLDFTPLNDFLVFNTGTNYFVLSTVFSNFYADTYTIVREVVESS